jgi:c(7)-type cytochrome triheme protein
VTVSKIILLAALVLLLMPVAGLGFGKLPSLLPPEKYGNILISRTSAKNQVKPATFSHWLHRRRHTCRVCHFELDFNMKVNTTEITEKANREGKFCGASGCHDGKAAFGHDKPHCDKCHNGNLGYGREKFGELANAPATPFGNRVDWVSALTQGMIAPRNYLRNKPTAMPFDKTLSLEAEWNFVPPSIFPHKSHTEWLDCNNCHPEIFNIKKKGTENFSMENILQGDFCGVCHLKVAFPMDDCARCHPGMANVL